MQKKVILIDPRSIRHGPPKEVVDSDSFINDNYVKTINKVVSDRVCNGKYTEVMRGKFISNYGLLMLGNLFKNNNDISIKYINGDYFNSKKEYHEFLINNYKKFNVVVLTSTTPQFNEVIEIAELFKKENNDIKIILGGPHSRYYLYNDIPECFDAVSIGNGIDKSYDVILKMLQNQPYDKLNVTDYYYDTDKDFSLIPSDKINQTMLYSYINFGCPNNCKYCVEHKFINKLEITNHDEKFREIKNLVVDYGVKFVHIADSDFLMHKATIEEFIDFIKNEKLNFCFSINTSPIMLAKYTNDEILKELKDVGLVEILIGAEHFSKEVISNLSKKYDIETFIEGLYYAKKSVQIPIISLYTLVGLPGEYSKNIEENINIIKKLKDNNLFDFTFPKFFVPYPDSDVYLDPDKYNVKIKNQNWDEYQRWQLPRPIEIIGMSDMDYLNEIIQINNIMIGDINNKENSDLIKKLSKDK